MQKGWDATGKLEPLWRRYPGGQEALAHAAGSNRTSLSAINKGTRKLGIGLATRLAAALNVSVLELGAPLTAGDAKGELLVERLHQMEDLLRGFSAELERMTVELADAQARLEQIGSAKAKPARRAAPKRRTVSS